MATCDRCSQPCSCSFSEDGYFGNRPDIGRNFTHIDGAGTTQDPFMISFYDQEEFRPRTAEVTIPNRSVSNGTSSGNFTQIAPATGSSLGYESPITFVLKNATGAHYAAAFHHYYIGASVTFAATNDATSNLKHLLLMAKIDLDGLANFETGMDAVIAGQTIPGGVDSMTLSASGFVPGVFADPYGGYLQNQEFKLYVFQNSGAAVNISDIRIWFTEI